MVGRYVELGERIVVLENEHDANLTCIALEDSLVFVDTGRRDNLATDPNGNDGIFLGHSIFFYRLGVSSKTIEILEEIPALPIDTVIPGHGPVISKGQTVKITEYLNDLSAIIRLLIKEGESLDELITDPRFKNFYETKPDYWSTIIQRQYSLISKEIQNRK